MREQISLLRSCSMIIRYSVHGWTIAGRQGLTVRSFQESCLSSDMRDSTGIAITIVFKYAYRMLTFTKTNVPSEVLEALEPIKQDDEEVRKFGTKFCIE